MAETKSRRVLARSRSRARSGDHYSPTLLSRWLLCWIPRNVLLSSRVHWIHTTMSYLCYLSMRRFATLSTSFRSSPSQTRRQYRHFSTTIRRAEEKPPTAQMTAVMKELSQTKLFKEIQNNEELLSSIQDAVQILEEEGASRNRPHECSDLGASFFPFATQALIREIGCTCSNWSPILASGRRWNG